MYRVQTPELKLHMLHDKMQYREIWSSNCTIDTPCYTQNETNRKNAMY